jgi:ubiquinone/menaquinone biosynthesis C-methylase UbiE
MGEKPIAAGKSSFELIDAQALFAELPFGPATTFLDLACGIGSYSLAAAQHVGSDGEIFAYDLWPEGIEILNKEIEARQIKQIQAGIADITQLIPLEDASVDICLLATVLHDFISIHAEQGALLEVARVLKPDAILAVIEFKVLDGPPGPPMAIRIAPEGVREVLAPFGFSLLKTTELGPFNYLSLFQRTAGR